MSSYTVVDGDSFSIIARKKYGSEQNKQLIIKANPGASEPLRAGDTLVIPSAPGFPKDKPQRTPSASVNEVAVLINTSRFRFWSDILITRSIDRPDTVELSGPFDANAPGFRKTFRPFSYSPIQVTVGGDILFTGTMIGATPALTDQEKTLLISAYSLPGVLHDCTPPASMHDSLNNGLENEGYNLRQLAVFLCEPFGVEIDFATDPGPAFDDVAPKPTDKIMDFISDLARQRNIVVSSTPQGKLFFQRSTSIGNPVAILKQGESPLLRVRASFSPQSYYSHITGLEPVDYGIDGSQNTVKNPHLKGVLRPLTFKSPDVSGTSTKDSVAAKMGRMFGNTAAYSIEVNTWRDKKGALWAPNTTIKLEAPDAMIYSSYEFIIRSVSLGRNAEKETAFLDLVLPGSFSGEIPEKMPWD